MRKILLAMLLAGAAWGAYAQKSGIPVNKNIPSLEEVSGVWVNADTITMTPSIRNFRAQAALNFDMASISWFASAPYSGGYHTGVMRVNGESVRAQLLRWYPWQSLRKATTPTYKIASTIKMVPESNGIMWEISISNSTKKAQHYNIEQDMIGFISHYAKDIWPWQYPFPAMQGKTFPRSDEIVNVIQNIGLPREKATVFSSEPSAPGFDSTKAVKVTWPSDSAILASSKYHILSSTRNKLIIADNETDALIGFGLIDAPDKLIAKNSGGTAYWSVTLKPGAAKKIRFFMTWTDNRTDMNASLNKWSNSFAQTFAAVEVPWKKRWQEMFRPHNSLFSGCFPVLETTDKVIRKIYYTGPVTALYMLNTGLPAHHGVIQTGGPRWGASVNFFWDTTNWSGMLALLDPAMMKEQIKSFIKIDPSKYFGQDNYSGKGVGNGYVANYWALFQLVRSYITTTGDYAFLNEYIADKRVIEHLDDYAYNWKKVSIYGQPGATDDIYKLADFGSDPWNVLECVPTYIHIIPSFNAGYVWMMRETADFHDRLQQPAKATQLRTDAGEMVQRLMKLYAGDGVWYTLFPNNKKIPVRHVLDFMYFGKYLNNDLSPTMRTEMVKFVEDELLTNTWMRALSLKDSAANYSDRPDHGPLGAYDAWPSGTVDALAQMGYADNAFKMYKSVEPVTYEGCWSQSHELWGDNKFNKRARVRIPERGWNCREAVAGIEFSQVLLKNFMGFYPDIKGNALQPVQKVNLTAKMHHVLYGGKYYTVAYSNGKSLMTAE